MDKITLHDKDFKCYISHEKILSVIDTIAERMNGDLKNKNPLFLCVLNGSFMFAAELLKRTNLLDAEISFVKFASYEGTETTGLVRELIGLNESIKGRTVVVLEDIVDTGITINGVIKQLERKKAKEVMVATLLLKPEALIEKVNLHYVGMEIPNAFIVGFGLDYDGRGRNLKDIYQIIE